MKEKNFNILEHLFYRCILLYYIVYVIFNKSQYLPSDSLWPDEALYAWHAQRIFENPFYIFTKAFSYPSLLPLLLSFGNFFDQPLYFYKLLCLLIGLAGIYAIYKLGSMISGQFLGIYAAMLLGINNIYYNITTKILLDGPVTVLIIFIAVYLLKFLETGSKKDQFILSVLCAAAVLTKVAIAILLLTWCICLTVLYLFNTSKPWDKNTRKLLLPFAVTLLSFVFYGFRNYLIIGRPFSSLTALAGRYFISEDYLCYIKNYLILLPNTFLPFVILGFVSLLKKGKKIQVLLLSWFIWLGTISMIPEKVPRYFLPMTPCVILISGLGVEYLRDILSGKKATRIASVLMALFLLIFLTYQTPEERSPKIRQRLLAYSGMKKAGEWIRSNLREDTLIMTSSIRALRYFSGINFTVDQGQLTRLPKDKEKFEKILSTHAGPVLIEYDRWHSVPFLVIDDINDNHVIGYLEKLGFKLKKTVIKPWFYTDGEHMDMPVVWLFSRPTVNNTSLSHF